MKIIRIALITIIFLISRQALMAQSIIGTWEHVSIVNTNDTLVTALTFNDDNTFVRYQEKLAEGFKNKSPKMVTREEGKWKLSHNGKKIMMRIKPSTVTVDSPEGKGIAKLSEISEKADALSSIYTPKIMSLTETELVLLESVEDGISGPDPDISYQHNEKFTYIKRK